MRQLSKGLQFVLKTENQATKIVSKMFYSVATLFLEKSCVDWVPAILAVVTAVPLTSCLEPRAEGLGL